MSDKILKCSGCGVKIKATKKHSGKKVPCPKCGEIISIPDFNEDEALEIVVEEELPEQTGSGEPRHEEVPRGDGSEYVEDEFEIMTGKQIEALVGKPKVLSVPHSLKYVSGVRVFDETGANNPEAIYDTQLWYHHEGIEISVSKGMFKRLGVAIKDSDISRVCVDGRNHTKETKGKSVVGRAIVGSLVAGPLGAVIGGMSGVGEKVVYGDSLITIIYQTPNGTSAVVLAARNKDKENVIKALTKHFGEKAEVLRD